MKKCIVVEFYTVFCNKSAFFLSNTVHRMEQRLASTFRMTVNEKKFIEKALLSDLRIDGRRPFDFRRISIKFGRQVFIRTICACVCVYFRVFLLIMIMGGF